VQPSDRRVVDGHDPLATRLVLDALNMSLAMRRPNGVIHHSDWRSQYTSIEFGHRCREANVRPSMGSVGDPLCNPVEQALVVRSGRSAISPSKNSACRSNGERRTQTSTTLGLSASRSAA
jgi:hypothetical protein